MRSVRILLTIVFLIICACAIAHAAAVGTVTYAEGRVDILPSDSQKWIPVTSGSSIGVGDAIRTKSNSKAEVTFNDKTIVKIARNSKVDVKEYQLDDNGNRKSANIMIERGKARTIIAKMKNSAEFKLCTPNSCGTVKGSDIFTFYQSGNSGMLVAEGALAVVNPAHPETVVNVPAGSAVLVPLEDAPKGPRKYLEMEEKSHAEDTDIPETLSTRKGASVIKGTIAKFTGDVKVTAKGSDAAHAARQGEIVSEGDKITTGQNSIVEITLDNGNAIYLKQNTDITILKLVIDAKTGEFENIFGTEKGDVKARIEGLKGKSKFEIKTPTAICGARGTIMLIHVAPDGATNSFFEGGNGYTTNLISGQTMDVGAGGGASTDAGGGVTGSEPPSDDDRAGMDDGFDPDGGTGDSTEGGDGEGLGDAGLGGGATNLLSDAVDTADASAGDTIDAGDVVDVPITEADGSILEEATEDEVIYGTAMGGMSYTTLDGNGKPNEIQTNDGALYDIGISGPNVEDPNDLTDLYNSYSGGGEVSMSIQGTRTAGSHQYRILTTEDMFGASSYGEGKTGGSVYLVMGGSIDGSEIRSIVAGIYIDENGNAGTIFGSCSGADEEAFTLYGSDFYVNYQESAVTVLPSELQSHLSPGAELRGEGYLEYANGASITTRVVSGFGKGLDDGSWHSDWGIWGVRIAGSYHTGSVSTIEGTHLIEIAGLSKDKSDQRVDGAWLMATNLGWDNSSGVNTIDSTSDGVGGLHLALHEDWTEGTLSVCVVGGSLQHGKAVGNYTEIDVEGNGAWQAVACGEWVDINPAMDIASISGDGTNFLSQLQGLSSVPITEITNSFVHMTGANGPITAATMDMRMYGLSDTSNNFIWTANYEGSFNGPVSIGLVVPFSGINEAGGDVTSNLTFTQFTPDGLWSGNVAGTAALNGGSAVLSGVARGTHDIGNGGNFSGCGIGTATQNPPHTETGSVAN
jgi:hypothetical protein